MAPKYLTWCTSGGWWWFWESIMGWEHAGGIIIRTRNVDMVDLNILYVFIKKCILYSRGYFRLLWEEEEMFRMNFLWNFRYHQKRESVVSLTANDALIIRGICRDYNFQVKCWIISPKRHCLSISRVYLLSLKENSMQSPWLGGFLLLILVALSPITIAQNETVYWLQRTTKGFHLPCLLLYFAKTEKHSRNTIFLMNIRW